MLIVLITYAALCAVAVAGFGRWAALNREPGDHPS